MTFPELDSRSDRLAERLVAAGCAPDRPVAYVGANSALVFEAWFAATKARSVFAPMNWRCSVAELEAILSDANPAVIFVEDKHLPSVTRACASLSGKHEIVSFTPDEFSAPIETWIAAGPLAELPPPPDPDSACLLAYTSGTTGVAKGVQMSHAAFVLGFGAGDINPAMRWDMDDVVGMTMPNFHLGGSFLSLQGVMSGATTVVLPGFDMDALLHAIARHRISILPVVPTALQMLLDHPETERTDMSSLRRVVYFGSPISPEVIRRAKAVLGCELVQYYGTTESWILTVLDDAAHDLSRPERLSSCGVPVPGADLRLLREDGSEAAEGEIGEIAVSSPTLFQGYWGKPELTWESFIGEYYRTGDLGRRDEDGFYYIVDRAKDMIISGGENIYSAEVERALLRSPDVSMAAVVGVPDDRWGERVEAMVVPADGSTPTEQGLQEHCRSLLAAYKVPKKIHFADALPLTANGKIHKPSIRDTLRASAQIEGA